MIRPLDNRVLWGVCAALAVQFGIGAGAMRLLWLFVAIGGMFFFFGTHLLAMTVIYIALAIGIPSESPPPSAPTANPTNQ